MAFTDTKRILRSGFVNFKRNVVVSLSSLLVMTITLSVIVFLIFSNATLSTTLRDIESKVDITVYFVTGADENQILDFKTSLERLPEVSAVTYTSRDEALVNFRARHETDYLTLQALDELTDNPLGATLDIKARDSSQYESIDKFLESDEAQKQGSASTIDTVNYHENKLVIDRINSLIHGSRLLGFFITIVLIIISILITFNTIGLAIYFAREEIGIMRLMGASNKYIRGPFIVEGMLYGIISSIITLLIFWPVSWWLGKNLTSFFSINLYDYFLHNFLEILVITMLSGIIISVFSSLLAIRKYLKK